MVDQKRALAMLDGLCPGYTLGHRTDAIGHCFHPLSTTTAPERYYCCRCGGCYAN